MLQSGVFRSFQNFASRFRNVLSAALALRLLTAQVGFEHKSVLKKSSNTKGKFLGIAQEITMKHSTRKNGRSVIPMVFLGTATALAAIPASNAETDTQQGVRGSMYEKSEPISQAPEPTVPQATPGPTGRETEYGFESEPTAAAGQEANTGSPLYEMSAEEIIGKTVVTPEGTELAEVDSLATKTGEGDRIYAVVTSGGLLGIGGEKVVIDLNELTLQNDKLQTSAIQSEEQLQQQPEFTEEEYVRIEQTDRPISDFASFGSKQQQPSQ